MRLPIPFEHNDNIIDDLEVKAPVSGLLADTSRAVDEGNYYSALLVLLSGTIQEYEPSEAKRLIKNMPYRTAEWLSLQTILKISPDDGFEGIYRCPRCGHEMVTNYDDDVDTRDFISQLYIGYADDIESIKLELEEPITRTSRGEVVDSVSSITLRHPTIDDCIKAEQKVGTKDPGKTQFAIYANAITEINGQSVNDKWKKAHGMNLFERMPVPALSSIGNDVSKYGLSSTIEKTCRKCGKTWQARVNTSNFFESALRA